MKKAFLIAMFFANQVFSHAQNVGIGTNNPTRAAVQFLDPNSGLHGFGYVQQRRSKRFR